MKFPAFFVSLVAVAVLSGCAGANPSAVETSAVPETLLPSSALPSPSGTPTASATLTPSPLDDVVLSSEGLGPIEIGEPMSATASDLVEWDPDYCGGGWVPVVKATADVGWDFFPISGESKSDPVTLIQVYSPRFTTVDGISAGSTVEELLDAGFEVSGEPSGGTGIQPYTLSGDRGELVAYVAAGNNEEAILGTVVGFDVIVDGGTPSDGYNVGKCH